MSGYSRLLNDLVNTLFQEANGRDWDDVRLASKAGLHVRTVHRLRYFITKLPQLKTVYALARAVGMNIALVRIKLGRKSA